MALVAVVLIVTCGLWALMVQRVVPNICNGGRPETGPGPITCPHSHSHPR